MEAGSPRNDSLEEHGGAKVSSPYDPAETVAPPWELVAAGRYRPRRIRGSFRGRELG